MFSALMDCHYSASLSLFCPYFWLYALLSNKTGQFDAIYESLFSLFRKSTTRPLAKAINSSNI